MESKPPAFPLFQPEASDLGCSWSWKSSSEENTSTIMLFNGLNHNMVPSTSGILNRHPRVKRKSESDDFIPNKHFVSEEKMIAHLSGLHLSDNFQPHNITPEQAVSEEEEEADMELSYNVNLTPEELEQRLKNAQRITLCDQVRKNLRAIGSDEIIPNAILNRIEEPCRALILWRAPPMLEQLITGYEDRLPEDDGAMDDNNNFSNNMDMDAF